MPGGEAGGEDIGTLGGVKEGMVRGDAEDAGGDGGAVDKVVGGEDKGSASLLSKVAEGTEDLGAAFYVQEGSGFIQQDQSIRFLISREDADKGGGDTAFLEFAIAERGNVSGSQSADFQKIKGLADRCFRAGVEAAVPAAFPVAGQADEFTQGETGDLRDPGGNQDGALRKSRGEGQGTCHRTEQAGEGTHQGGLAAAVRSAEQDAFARFQGQVDSGDQGGVAESNGQPGGM